MKIEKDFDEDGLAERNPIGCVLAFALIALCTATALMYLIFFTLSKILIALS